jgi:hypothetical protein
MTIAHHQASRAQCRPIAEDDLEGVADLLTRGFPRTRRDYWMRGFARWKMLPAVAGCRAMAICWIRDLDRSAPS